MMASDQQLDDASHTGRVPAALTRAEDLPLIPDMPDGRQHRLPVPCAPARPTRGPVDQPYQPRTATPRMPDQRNRSGLLHQPLTTPTTTHHPIIDASTDTADGAPLPGCRVRCGQGSCQNAPVKSSCSRMAMFCSLACGVHSGGSRSLHQAWASSLSLLIGMVAPGFRPPSHRAMCASDRKRFIVLQVNTMSSHQCTAGTRQ